MWGGIWVAASQDVLALAERTSTLLGSGDPWGEPLRQTGVFSPCLSLRWMAVGGMLAAGDIQPRARSPRPPPRARRRGGEVIEGFTAVGRGQLF